MCPGIPFRLVKNAWRHTPKGGTHFLSADPGPKDYYKHSNGLKDRRKFKVQIRRSRHNKSFRVTKSRNLVLFSFDHGSETRIVAFPEATDSQYFRKAAKDVGGWGPSQDNPTAVGTAAMTETLRGNYNEFPFLPKMLVFDFVQSHFRMESDVLNQPNKNRLPRKIFDKYAGWRKSLIKETILIAQEKGIPLVVDEFWYFMVANENKTVLSEMRKVCKEMGLTKMREFVSERNRTYDVYGKDGKLMVCVINPNPSLKLPNK
jgi:hypothetical protein